MPAHFHMRRPKPIVPRPLVFLFAAGIFYIILYVALISLLRSPSMYGHLATPELQERNTAIIGYLRGPLFAQSEHAFLTAAEQEHMTDVKRVFDIAFIIALVAAGLIMGIAGVFVGQRMWSRLDELLSRSLRAAGWTILGLALFLVLASLLNFERLWFLFHAVFFPQGNWLFPVDSMLITLYPGAFFERFVMLWLLSVTAFGIAAVALGHLLDRMRRHDEFFTEKFEQRSEQKAHKEKRHQHKR